MHSLSVCVQILCFTFSLSSLSPSLSLLLSSLFSLLKAQTKHTSLKLSLSLSLPSSSPLSHLTTVTFFKIPFSVLQNLGENFSQLHNCTKLCSGFLLLLLLLCSKILVMLRPVRVSLLWGNSRHFLGKVLVFLFTQTLFFFVYLFFFFPWKKNL